MKLSTILTIALISSATATNQYSQQVNEQINVLLNQINIAKAQVYDQAGNLRDGLIDTWTDSQLKEWLTTHSLQGSIENLNANANDYSEKLRKQVLTHKDILLADIKYYQDEAKAKADPIIGKSKEFYDDKSKQGQEKASDLFGQVQETLYIQYENAKRAVNDLYEKFTSYAGSKVDL